MTADRRPEKREVMDAFKFERLEVWQLSLEYLDLCYAVAERLPKQEEYNLKAQLIRAGTSIALNVAEGSTSQSDPEQARFLGFALRSLIETVACRRVAQQRTYVNAEDAMLTKIEQLGQKLFAKLQAMRHSLIDKVEGSSGSSRPSSVSGRWPKD